MGRSAIESNEYIFNKLKVQAVEKTGEEIGQEVSTTKYYIESSAGSKTWLTDAKVTLPIFFQNNTIITKLTYDKKNIFVVVAEDEYQSVNTNEFAKIEDVFESKEEDFSKFEGGLLTLVISDLEIQPKSHLGYEIVQILISDQSVKAVGINSSLIKPLFPKIQFFFIEENSIFNSYSIEQLFICVLLENRNRLKLNWDEDALNAISATLTPPHTNFPYHCLINSLQSQLWSNAFLEVYKPLEFLFSIPKVKKLRELINSNTDLVNLAIHVENSLGWRASEEQAFEALIGMLSELQNNSISRACLSLNETDSDQPNPAKRIYKLRNSIVHFRPATTPNDIGVEQWRLIVKELCKSAIELYRKLL